MKQRLLSRIFTDRDADTAAFVPLSRIRSRRESRKKKKNAGGTVAATAVAAATAAGMLVGGAYASPDDLMNDGPAPIVQTLVADSPLLDDGGALADDGVSEEESDSEEEKRGVYTGVRRLVRLAPSGVRALVGVPLWAMGTAATLMLSTLWASVLSPAAAQILSWAFIALTAALIFALAVKTAFPDLPLKKILNKRSLLCIGVLCLICGVADAALPLFWDDYQKLSALVKVVGSFVCTGVPVAFFARLHNRRKPEKLVAEVVEEPEPEPEPEPELTPEEKERASRELVRELADSVCPKTY